MMMTSEGNYDDDTNSFHDTDNTLYDMRHARTSLEMAEQF